MVIMYLTLQSFGEKVIDEWLSEIGVYRITTYQCDIYDTDKWAMFLVGGGSRELFQPPDPIPGSRPGINPGSANQCETVRRWLYGK